MRSFALVACTLTLAGCGGASIENSGDAANPQLNAIAANQSEFSGRDGDAEALAPASSQRGLMPQEPPRGR